MADRYRSLRALALCAAAVALLASGCAPGRVTDGVYTNSATGFRIPIPGAPWTAASIPEVDIAFHHPDGGTLAAFSECGGTEHGPIRVIARRLFFGLKDQTVLEQHPSSLNGATAVQTVVRGTLDGQAVVVESVVARRGTCVYDVVLAAPPDVYPGRRPDFDRMVSGWEPLQRNAE
jgi:hypothetical protein